MRVARMRRRAAAVAVALVLGAPLLGGCGIPETDVIEAGGPATVQAFLTRGADVLLFFRSPDGRVRPVIRTVRILTVPVGSGAANESSAGQSAQLATEKIVTMLLAGPQEDDRAAGLDTRLPAALPGVPVRIGSAKDGRATARVPLALDGLDDTALRQLTCTIAYGLDVDGRTAVDLTGQDGATRSGTCGLAPGSTGGEAAQTGTGTAPPG
ncbi:hypothetical protein PYK79_25445 [Streptomyces sp. ID05-04B]|uniref:hypothetical protein n=1 Tax=unclassified Streptomyces TaxID=2593676 RepID=UPI000D1B6FA4|nr:MULTISPECIES: hypothetical protein [unclassified Streptomyces]AVV41790.1 hypothetical protein C6376_10390 [Streptomyces sp. P3]MDX5565977.1 hypothetical protein [Streptomyces sp. ID05-04B]